MASVEGEGKTTLPFLDLPVQVIEARFPAAPMNRPPETLRWTMQVLGNRVSAEIVDRDFIRRVWQREQGAFYLDVLHCACELFEEPNKAGIRVIRTARVLRVHRVDQAARAQSLPLPE